MFSLRIRRRRRRARLSNGTEIEFTRKQYSEVISETASPRSSCRQTDAVPLEWEILTKRRFRRSCRRVAFGSR